MQLAPKAKPVPSILVVDDEEIICRLLRNWLEFSGYEVRTAPGAVPALELTRANPPDVALCDIRMPGPSGVWLIEQLRREFPETAVVVVTGLTEMDPSITLRDGVVGYITKPLRRETLMAAVAEALRQRPGELNGPASRN